MEIMEKVAYLKGLAEGMELDTEKKEGKLLAAIIDLLEDMALEIEDLWDGEEELYDISQGVLCKIIERGEGDKCPRNGNVVTVHYKGSLINGKIFDSSYERGYPEAFRLSDLIVGWQIALT